MACFSLFEGRKRGGGRISGSKYNGMCCPETSVNNYLRCVTSQEGRRSHFPVLCDLKGNLPYVGANQFDMQSPSCGC